MKRVLIVIAAVAIACAAYMKESCAGAAGWMPLANGAVWSYSVHGGEKAKAQIRVDGSKNGAWTLQWDGHPVQAQAGQDGVVFLETRHVGVAGTPATMPMAEVRWSGDDNWKTKTASGCMMFEMTGKRVGHETITVPAGRYDCVKVTIEGGGTQTFWIARGVGIVKHTHTNGPALITWELERYQPGH